MDNVERLMHLGSEIKRQQSITNKYLGIGKDVHFEYLVTNQINKPWAIDDEWVLDEETRDPLRTLLIYDGDPLAAKYNIKDIQILDFEDEDDLSAESIDGYYVANFIEREQAYYYVYIILKKENENQKILEALRSGDKIIYDGYC